MQATTLTARSYRHTMTIAVLLLALGSATQAGPNKTKTAKSAGNDQTTFTMKLNATSCPFCNTTETVQDPNDTTRFTAAAYLPALIAPGSCGLTSANWELNQDPFVSQDLFKGGKFQAVTWGNVVSGLYITKFGTFKTTISASVKAGQQDVTLKASAEDISASVRVGDTVVIDNVGRELATITRINGQNLNIRGGGDNSGWQSDHVADVPLQVAAAQGSDCEAGKAEVLLDRAFRYGFCNTNAYNLGSTDLQVEVLDPKFDKNQADFYIVNLVVWKKADANYSPSMSHWYVYNRGDHGHWYRQRLPYFGGTLRIYGSNKPIGLIAIHIRSNGSNAPTWDEFKKLGISYTVSVKSKTPANVADLQTALSIIAGGAAPQVQGAHPEPDGFYGTMLFKAKAAADITVTADVDFSKLAPQGNDPAGHPQQNPSAQHNSVSSSNAQSSKAWDNSDRGTRGFANTNRTAYSLPHVVLTNLNEEVRLDRRDLSLEQQGSAGNPQQGNQGNATKPQSGNQNNANNNTNQKNAPQTPQNPSIDCQPTTSNGKQSPCKLTATVNDEDLYHWDVSFAVPFHTISELQYNQPTGSGNSIVPKNVTRLNAYALFDVYPVASDIVTPPIVSVPHVFAGLPISGKVFNKPMFGAGDTFNLSSISFLKFLPIQFGFFGAVIYNKQFTQIPGTTGAANVTGHRVWKGSYGIEIPVMQFKSLLSSKNSNNNNSASSKSSNSKANN